ncbi:hypothetical protein EA58_16560 [Photobacterium galatheae]|uniref:DUF7151 domain-containing protein n=2 Tax=Photobacterium galatheae TaxID=1654360 RepID=A0A066RJB9_9GAMM|nr:hypothetical protein EA58_16560 [Photobacterium galatheae]
MLTIMASTLTACWDDDNDDPSGSAKTAMIRTEVLAVNDENCATGGVRIIAGYDDNQNAQLDAAEYVSSKYICNNGQQSTDGEGSAIFDQALVGIAFIAKDDVNCPAGGQKIFLGVDKNTNSVLDSDEVTETQILCSDGSLNAPESVINALTASPSTIVTNGNSVLEATITNPSAVDAIVWQDEAGKPLQPRSQNEQNILDLQAGSELGQFTYRVSIEKKDSAGKQVLQTKSVTITVSQAPSATQTVSLESRQVFLPDDFTMSPVTGDITGTVIYGDPKTASVKSLMRMAAIPTPESTELVGFVAERGALNQGTTAAQILQTMVNAVSNNLPSAGDRIDQFSQTILEGGDVSASYNITLISSMLPTNLLQILLQQMAVNQIGGATDTLTPASTEVAAMQFQLDIVVSYLQPTDSLIITATLVDKNNVDLYADVISATTSENISAALGSTLELQADWFRAVEQTTSKADFLFVIDNSGSMSDEQNKLSSMTQSFINTIGASGIDFKVGTITTDTDVLRGVGFTHDASQIETDFIPGTSGSATERGIWFAEKSLDPVNGTVTLAGYPRTGASMSVIIVSDEPSQYGSTPQPFDPSQNLFVDNGYRVYAIVKPGDASRSQYDDLAVATLGKVLNIDQISEYDSFMNTVANNAGATSAGYKLSLAATHQILSSSLSVKVDGVDVPRSTVDGWQYYPLSQSVVFTGAAIPPVGAQIYIAYQYVQTTP